MNAQPQPSPPELLPPKLAALFFTCNAGGNICYAPSRYKAAYGGRGSGKSWGFCGLLVALAAQMPLRILCLRETMNTLGESVLKLLADRIEALGLASLFEIQRQTIIGPRFASKRSEFIFRGMQDAASIKSLEGIDIAYCEQAEQLSAASWQMLTPTVRAPGSEIWLVLNPVDLTDPTYQRFIATARPDTRRVLLNWDSNPYFPPELDRERRHLLQQIREASDDDERVQLQQDYDHIWMGEPLRRSDAAVFRRRVVVESFEEPPNLPRLFYGADWGFSTDPTVLIRFWITDEHDPTKAELWISHEAYGYGVSIDNLPQLFDTVPGSRAWPIKADGSQPAVIGSVAARGFNITAAEKWPGSVEDGIRHVQGFKKIHIHTRCKHMQEEARLYSYKIDRKTEQVLPVVVGKWDHGWDSVRYGLDGYILRGGSAGVWYQLGKGT